MTEFAAAAPLPRVMMRLCAIYCFIAIFGSNLGRAAAQQGGLTPAGLTPAEEEGPCSLARAIPAIVALVDEDFDLLLDDGRRVALAGLEFPSSGGQAKTIREAALSRLSNWLAGEQIFLSPLASGPDRWGRAPAQAIAACEFLAGRSARFGRRRAAGGGARAFSPRPGRGALREDLS